MRTPFKAISLISLLAISVPVCSVVLTSAPKKEMVSSSSAATSALYDQGLAALEKKQFDVAERLFKDAARSDPTSPLPLLGLAEIARINKEDAEAEKLVRKALALAPDSPDSQLAIGRLFYVKKNYLGAESSFLKAIALAPAMLAPLLDLAELNMNALNKPDKAAALFRQAISLKPDHAGAYFGLGNAYFALKNYSEAILSLNKASSLAAANPMPKIILSQVYAAVGDNKAAILALKEAARLAPKMPDIPLKLGMLYQQAQQWSEAYAAYEATLKLSDQSALAYNNLAWMAADRKERLDEALRWANKAIQLAPNEAGFKDTLAWVKRARGDANGALAVLLPLMKAPDASAEVFYHFAQIKADAGQKSEAMKAYRRVLQIDPNFSQANDVKARIRQLE